MTLGSLSDLSPWWAPAAWTATEWVIRLVMLVYVPQRRPPAAARTWLLLIFLLPWLGLFLYALVGRVYYPNARRQKLERINLVIDELRPRLAHLAPLGPLPEGASSTAATLIKQVGSFSPLRGNQVTFLDDYDDAIATIIRDIDAAVHHVHILMYIYAADHTGRMVSDALLRAAARGVDCRVFLDAIGARDGLRTFRKELQREGIKVVKVLPVASIPAVLMGKKSRLDLRNHRKIIVVDGRVGYMGSQNIIDAESIPGLPNEELVVRVQGPVVAQLQAVFLADRYLETEVHRIDPDFFPEMEQKGETIAQMLPSGPGYGTLNTHMALVSLIHNARKRVVITTPYFVPDEAFLEALHIACYRGLDVHLILSRRINQKFTQAAQEAHYGVLLASGVHIHLYRPAFLHAKHVTIDDSIAMVGSPNMDIRSFALNAEAALVMYDPEVVSRISAIQARYLASSDTVNQHDWARRPLHLRTWQNLCRLADSLL